MKRSISLPLALGIALALPFYANSASDSGNGASGPSGSSGAGNAERMQPGQTGTANPESGNMTARHSHPTDGTSRNKDDCVKTGCVDNGGN
jgi:hypothetical protein